MILFGKVTRFSGARVTLELVGVAGNATIEALYLLPGSSAAQVWLPPAPGDVVAVAYNDERPEDSLVLGRVYADGDNPPRTGGSEVAIEAGKVYLGDDVNSTRPCSRDDHVQAELSAIKAELDKISVAFNAHTHICAAVGAASATPNAGYNNGYSVGSTASDSVEVK
jgi:hypothetical protein